MFQNKYEPNLRLTNFDQIRALILVCLAHLVEVGLNYLNFLTKNDTIYHNSRFGH